MDNDEISPFEVLRIIYQEIIDGYSPSSKGEYFFKHFSEIESIQFLRKKHEFYDAFLKQGLPSQRARIAQLIEMEEWSQDQEDRITSLRYMVSDNEKNLPHVIPQMKLGLEKAINRDKQELANLLTEKYLIIGTTADEMSGKDSRNYETFCSLCKDKKGTPMYDSWEEFEHLETDVINGYNAEYNELFLRISEDRIRELSAMPFFLNGFSYARENMVDFLNKPLVQLTQFQSLLFSSAQRNINVHSQSHGSPPEIIGDIKPSDVLTWYDREYSVILGKRNASK